MAEPLLNIFPNTEPEIDIFEQQPMQLPIEVANQRAAKATFGNGGQFSVDPQTLAMHISNGSEARMRQLAARERDLSFRKAKHEMIREEMKNRDGDMSPQEIQFYMGLSEKHISNPETVWETDYAEKFLSTAVTLSDEENSSLKEALDEDPEKAMSLLDGHQWIMANKEIVQRQLEDLEAEYAQQSTTRGIEDTVEQFVPFLSQARTGAGLFGNQDERIAELLLMPPDQMAVELKKDVDELKASNYKDAMEYLHNVLSQSTSDKAFDNLFTLLDIADVATLGTVGALTKAGKVAAKMPQGVARLSHTLREVVKAGGSRNIDTAQVSAAAGDIERAAVVTTLKTWFDKFRQLDPTGKSRRVLANVGSIHNPTSFTAGPKRLSNTLSRRLDQEMEQQGALLLQAASQPGMASRLGDTGLLIAGEKALRAVKDSVQHLSDAVLDIAPEFRFDNLTNTYSANIALGRSHGVLFKSEKEAIKNADLYGLSSGSYRIVPQGDGYYINISKDIDETLGEVRDALTLDLGTQTPSSVMDFTMVGMVRSPEDVLSALNRENRHAVTHAAQDVLNLVGQVAKSVGKLSSNEKKRLDRVLKENRDADRILIDKDGKEKPVRGRYWNSVGEFERGFYKENHQFPSYKETKAYFTMRQLNDFSYMMLNYSLYRDKSRMGIARYSFQIQKTAEDGKVTTDSSRYFEGKEADTLPTDEFDDGIAIYNQDSGKTTYIRRLSMTKEERDYLDELLKEKAYKMIQIANPMDKPMADQLGVPDTINFLIVRDYKHKVLDHNQIPYRPGGPVIYSDEVFAKQGRIRETSYGSHEYEGDISVMSFSNDAKGRKYTKHLDEARKLLKAERDGDHSPLDKSGGAAAVRYKGKIYKGPTHIHAYDEIIEKEGKTFKNNLADWYAGEEMSHVDLGEQGFVTKDGRFVDRKEAEKLVTKVDKSDYTDGLHSSDLKTETDKSLVNNYVRENLPITPAEFRKMFEPDVDEAGNVTRRARLNLDTPIVMVRSKVGTNDIPDVLDYRRMFDNFEDVWDHPRNLYRELNKKHTGEREQNLLSVREAKGSEDNPLVQVKDPRLLDPMQSMNKLVSHFMRSRFMDDYEIHAAEHWVAEFGHLMKEPMERLRQNPIYYLKNGTWRPEADHVEKARARAARVAIVNLLGTPGVVNQATDWLKHKIVSGIYNKLGDRPADIVADRLLPTTIDPFKYARGIAFHTKLGMFNPVQLFLQAQTLTHILAVSPRYAGQSFVASFLMRRLSMAGHEAIPEHFAKMASKMGWNYEDFIESFNELRKTGLWHVEGEQAFRDDVFDVGLIKNTAGRVGKSALDVGLFFFRESERMVRLTAWNAAYREWKVANPGKLIGNRERAAILRRQNDLSVNMTRASNASYQQGIFSIPSQFLGYQLRLMEQFLGKRLTWPEKARAFAVYSMLYGVPTATGAVAGVWPMYDSFKKQFMERGFDVDHPVLETFLDGIPAVIAEMATGSDMNWSERYGPGGLRVIKEIAHGEKEIIEIVLGASGSILADMWASADPSVRIIQGVFGSEENKDFPLTLEDFIDQSSNISTINNFARAFYALNAGRYITKNEIFIGEVNTWDTFFMSMTGTVPQEITDAYLMIESNQQVDAIQKEAKKHIIKYYRRGYQHIANGDQEAAYQAFIAARTHFIGAGFRDDQASDLLSEAMNGYGSLVDKARDDFFFNKVRADEAIQRQERYMDEYGAQ